METGRFTHPKRGFDTSFIASNTEGIMTHTKESIVALLDKSDKAVYAAIKAIQKRQTADEQAGHMTRHTNGIGWSKFDAAWMADMIVKVDRYGSLFPKPLAITRNKVKRYWRQMVEIANENAQAGFGAISGPAAVPATIPSVTPDGVSDGDSDCGYADCVGECRGGW